MCQTNVLVHHSNHHVPIQCCAPLVSYSSLRKMSEFHNFSCEHFVGSFVKRSNTNSFQLTVKLLLIFVVTLLIIVFNLCTILILRSKHYSCHLRELPKTLMTSLSFTDLSMGLFVTPVCFVSLAKGCFPFRKEICEIQALLISSLFHSSSLLLISISIDRYICINYPLRYRSIMTKKVCDQIYKADSL